MPDVDAVHVESAADDYTHSSVPLRERRDPVTMGLLWVTMVTGFPSVLQGFDWYKQGISFTDVICLSIVSCGLLMLYSLPACYLGARSGLTYALLSRKVFGRWGSRIVSLNLCWISLAWYGVTAVYMAENVGAVFHLKFDPLWPSILCAVAMAFNNFFGFAGVANFARYAAGPILILWVLSGFAKAAAGCPSTVWHESGHAPMMTSLTTISAFVIGYSSWGNEADYWRFGKPQKRHIVIPLMVALLIGEILFPLTGWMFGRTGGSSETATNLMDNFAFGGMPVISAIILFVTYFAVNDSTLYGSINALENITKLPRRKVVTLLTGCGALAAAVLSGMAHNFEVVCSISCIVLPSATVVILAEQFLRAREGHKDEITSVPPFEELPAMRWKALIALIAGCVVGITTQCLNFGVPSLQAWAAALATYLVLRKPDRYTIQPPTSSGEIHDKSDRKPDSTHSGIQNQTANRS